MTKAQLLAYGGEQGVSGLSSRQTKATIINMITENILQIHKDRKMRSELYHTNEHTKPEGGSSRPPSTRAYKCLVL